jgi:hypothetical protein
MESANCKDLSGSHSNFNLSSIQKRHSIARDPLLVLNEELDHLRLPHEINEPLIEKLLIALEDSGASDQSCYWLLMARIFELALFCAGHYADNCELAAAGDLLVNPRKILIHRKGYPDSLIKPRHGRISEQLRKNRRSRKHLMLLLKHEVTIEIAKPPILPYLFEQMETSQKIASWYLDNAQERIKKIADTIGFLSAWSVSKFEDFHQQMQTASSKTCRFIGDHLCQFDTRYFERLGREIKNFIENAKNDYVFLARQ